MTYRNSLSRNPLSFALISALAFTATAPAFAQEAAEQATTNSGQRATTELDKVTVTGSRIKRTEVEGPAPVTIVTAADIEKQGFSTVYDALNTLSQFTGSVQNELNANGFTPNGSFLNLRGLGPGYQLVLINGRRAADYPLPYNGQSNAVNLANIPAAAIDRIEVLAGGASAIYGSDAVAGVVNIIMKTNFDGDLFSVRAGTTTRGGGDTGRFQWVGGKTSERASLTYAFEFLGREAIYARQRKFMDSTLDDPSITDPANATSYPGIRYTAWVDANGNPTANPSAPGRKLGWLMADNLTETCGRFAEFDPVTASGQAYCGYFGYPAGQSIRNSDKTYNTYAYGTYDVTDSTQAWAQLSYSNSQATVASASRFFSSAAVLGSNNFYDPNIGGVVGNVYRFITPSEIGGGGGQPSKYKEQSMDLAAGLRGSVFDGRFDWDATVSHSRYEADEEYNWLVQSKVRDLFFGPRLGTHAGTGYGIYAMNMDRLLKPLSSADVKAISSSYKNESSSQVTQGSLVISGDLFEMPAGSLSMAAVLEAAGQKYDVSPDARARLDYEGDDAPMGLTSTGGTGTRDRYSAGLEFSIPLLASLKANLAGRYDKFDDASDVNGAFTWSSGLEWRPINSLLLRGSYATSFKAPDMHYIYAGESGFYTYAFDEYACRAAGLNPTSTADCGGSLYHPQVFGTRKGDPRLKAEEGKSFTAGVVWDIMDDLSLTVDYYNIELEGAISDLTGRLYRDEAACRLGTNRDGSPVDATSERCVEVLGRVMRDSNGDIVEIATYPQNQAMTKTSGIDASADYRLTTDRMGKFGAKVAWTHVLKLDVQQYDGEVFEDRRDHKQYFNFRSRLNWEVNWERDDWAASVYGYRWGSLPNWAETGRIAPHIIWNTNIRKKITNKATVGLYVNNVFDKIHPRDDTYNSYPYFFYTFSPVGREVFIQFDYKFN